MSEMPAVAHDFRVKFEVCARRFHEKLRSEGDPLHRFWNFENCPAATCSDARQALESARELVHSTGGNKP